LLQKNKLFKELLHYLIMVAAFAVISFGLTAMIQGGIGAPPWDVLHLGLSNQLGLTYGRVAQGIGLVLILISWVLGVRPKLGTILNMIFIGLFVDLYTATGLVPHPQHTALQLIQLGVGTVIFAYGTAIYILVNRGTGPRDSFMVALSRLSGLKMGLIRTFIEVAVTITGFLLGGPLGFGTVLFAFSVGPLMELFFKVGRRQAQALKLYLDKEEKRLGLKTAAKNEVS
jgi:uncharacterized protein